MRIAEALSKMKLQPFATEADVEEALRLFQVSTLDAARSGTLSGERARAGPGSGGCGARCRPGVLVALLHLLPFCFLPRPSSSRVGGVCFPPDPRTQPPWASRYEGERVRPHCGLRTAVRTL